MRQRGLHFASRSPIFRPPQSDIADMTTFTTLGTRHNFLGIEKEYSSFAGSQVAILPVPYERTVSYGTGTKSGPRAILDASHQVEFYDEETGLEVHRTLGIATLRALETARLGDEAALEMIHARGRGLLAKNKPIGRRAGDLPLSRAFTAASARRLRAFRVVQIMPPSDPRQCGDGRLRQ